MQSAEYWGYNDKLRDKVFALKHNDPDMNQIIIKIFNYSLAKLIQWKSIKY